MSGLVSHIDIYQKKITATINYQTLEILSWTIQYFWYMAFCTDSAIL
jgi:hypothetical protein